MTNPSTWREIITRCRNFQGYDLERGKFWRKCAMELDATGFCWSQECISPILSKLNLPDISAESFSAPPDDDKLVKLFQHLTVRPPIQDLSPAPLGSSVLIKGPLNLIDLPIEVMEKIILHVQTLARSEDCALRDQRATRVTEINKANGMGSYKINLHTEEPILNTLQSLAVVNQALHRLCLPFLWKTLRFPTELWCPIGMWTDIILPKHGAHVRSLDIEILMDAIWFTPYLSYQAHFYDNTCPSTPHLPRGISPRIANSLLALCPNLVDLTLWIPDLLGSKEVYSQHVHMFMKTLVPNLCRLTQLRHIGLKDENYSGERVSKEVLIPILENLPQIETITCMGFGDASDKVDGMTIGRYLSNKKNLKRIDLVYFCGIDERWCDLSWPDSLNTVSINECSYVTPLVLHKLVSKMKNVTCLRFLLPFRIDNPYLWIFPWGLNLQPLGFHLHNSSDDEDLSTQPDWIPHHEFILPELTDLTLIINRKYMTMLNGFQSCKKLENLMFGSWDVPPDCHLIHYLISNNTWPSLKSVTLTSNPNSDIPPLALRKLSKYCKQAGIQLKVEQLE